MSIFSAPAPSFYGAEDQAIYNRGFSFVPRAPFREDFVEPIFPTAPTTTTTGGITTVPRTTALDIGGNRDDNNPFNPDMNQIRTDFRPDFEFRRGTEAPLGVIPGDTSMFDIRSLGLGLRTETERNKFMDMYPEFFDRDTGVPRTGIAGFFDKAINFIPGAGMLSRIAPAIQNILPVNQRAILENQARGQGIFTDDIGRIVGDPNTAQGIMAGYNLNKITRDTFNKRRKNIEEGLMKVDPEAARERLGLLDEAEEDLFGSVSTPGFIGPFTQGGIFGKKAAITKMRKDQRIAAQKEKERLAKLEKARQDKIRLDKLRLKREAEQAAAAAKEKAQRAAIDKMFQQGRGGRGQDFTGGRFDRAGDRATYDRNPTGFSGSFMDGGLVDLVDIYD